MNPRADSSRGGRRDCLRPFAILALAILAGAVLPGRLCAARSLAGAEVAFTHGVLALAEGKDQEAARLFEEALRFDRGHGTARHWLGLTYLKMRRPKEAAAEIRRSLRARHPPAAGRTRVLADLWFAQLTAGDEPAAARTLARLARQRPEPSRPQGAAVTDDLSRGTVFEGTPAETVAGVAGVTGVAVSFPPSREFLPPTPRRWQGRLGLAAAHDSNPGLLPEELGFAVPGAGGLGEPSADRAADLDLRLEHLPFYGRRGWSLELALAGQQSLYEETGDLDLSQVRGLASLAWGNDRRGLLSGPLGTARVPVGERRVSLLLQAGGGSLRLGGEPFLETAEGAVSVKVQGSRRTALQLDLGVVERSFSDDPRGALRRSGQEASAGVRQLFLLGRKGSSLELGLSRGERRAGPAFDADFSEATVEAGVPLARRWSLLVLGSRREDRFADPGSSLAVQGGPQRDDTTWRAAAGLAWRATDRLSWELRGSHARRESNAPVFEYRRTVVSLGVSWDL